MTRLPEDHPQRFQLSNEVHARPPERMTAPFQVSGIALTTAWPYRDADRQLVVELTEQYGATPPGPGVKHYSVDLQDFRLIWERHTEFTRYTFITHETAEPFSRSAISAVPAKWLAKLPGEMIAAAHADVMETGQMKMPEALDHARKFFSGNALIGSSIADGRATAVTDFRIHADGFSRFLLMDPNTTPWHLGRIVQRLLEIETYRVVALLALPVAQSISGQLIEWETELAEITGRMGSDDALDEPELLDRLTRLQAAVEKSHTDSQFRFSAANAYYALVQRRIGELREARLSEIQTFQEFIERRLAPALATCESVAQRQESLSERADRAAQLLSTRVDMSLERQNASVLESMNTRADLQLRLQQTVEGLSVAAITYYTVGVIGYFAKGLEKAGWSVDPALVMGIAAPIVLALSIAGIWYRRRTLEAAERAVAEKEKTD
jgi:uncharacterized membrane-anchored protein